MLDIWVVYACIQSHMNLAGLTSIIITFKDHAVIFVYLAGLTSKRSDLHYNTEGLTIQHMEPGI